MKIYIPQGTQEVLMILIHSLGPPLQTYYSSMCSQCSGPKTVV